MSLQHGQRGMALITSLLLLLVVTILAVAMFRGFSIQGRIAGNVREKQRAVTAAVSAEQYAEWWLTQGNNAASAPVVCAAPMLDANLSQGQICSNQLKRDLALDVTKVPWTIGTDKVGISYVPNQMIGKINADAPGQDSFYSEPSFYIADMGVSADGQGEVYQVDAAGWGAAPNSVAVVESTFEVTAGVVCRSCL
jgi:type IV pilus assembly protein PilX